MTGEKQEPSGVAFALGLSQALVFSPEVLEHFWAHAQIGKKAPESGGQLFARIAGDQVEVIKATGPYKTDLLSRYLFVPSKKKQRSEIKALFDVGLHYVGDWHTHPQALPEPSSLDVESMQECFAKSRHELQSFIMVVVGTEQGVRGLWVSLHNSTGYLKLLPTGASGSHLG